LGRGTKAITLLLLLSTIGCHSAEEKLKEQKHQESARIEREIADLRAHYNAVADWPKQLKENTFTIDVEPIFLRDDRRPILFFATLDDIRKESDGVFLYFSTIPTDGEPAMRLILDCGECDLQALKKSGNSLGDFAVVAQVTGAAKSLDAAENAPEYVLHGKFIDARYVGDYAMNRFLASQPAKTTGSE